ncbi:MAG: amino acid adenylation domain-containing protein [Pseudomonadota bacterium]
MGAIPSHKELDAPPEKLALSAAQTGIWLGQQFDPGSPAYWTAEAVELSGVLDAVAFETALRQAVRECDALHQRYTSDGNEVWQTLQRQIAWPLAWRDFSQAEQPMAAAQAWMQADGLQRADLEHGPLFASALLQLDSERTLWFLRVHHIALDGFGYTLLTQRVADLYSARVKGSIPPAPRNNALAPVVEEDQAYRLSVACARDRDFWCAHLDGAAPPTLLAPPQPVAHGVRRQRGDLPAAALAQWQAAAALAGVDWTAWIIAVVAAWLQRSTGAAELTLGLPVMARLGSVALAVPCMAMNIVPLRLKIDTASSLTELARLVSSELRRLRPHQRYRYEQLKHDLGNFGTVGTISGQRRLFGAVINLMPFDRPLQFGALTAATHPVSAGPVEDLAINIAPRSDAIRLDLEANPDAYDAATLATHRTTLLAALDALTRQPDQPLQQVLGRFESTKELGKQSNNSLVLPALLSGGALPVTAQSVLSAMQAHARAMPDRIALEQDGIALSYSALLKAVQILAARLRQQGVVEGSRVVLLLPRAPNTMVALLATMWAGAAYVPLDPDGPALRIAAVLADATPGLVICMRAHAALVNHAVPLLCLDEFDGDDLPSDLPPDLTPMSEPLAVAGDAVAYVIYTSGSTGRPNGVMVGRDALAHFVVGATGRYGVTANDRVLQFAPLHFDASVEEIFLSLCAGATLILRNDAMLESLPRFLATCAQLQISLLDLPTAFWHELAFCIEQNQAALPTSVRLVIIGGEAALAERVARWRASVASHVVLLNTYGPTEATVICTTAQLAGPDAIEWEGDAVPIGQPLVGVDIAVVDADLRPVAIGDVGELCLIGGGLARGYLGRATLTAQRFVTLPALASQPRAYRTGDRVSLGSDGQLRYLGRLDDELKLSGHRIDPLEIEAALMLFPGLREAAVVAQTMTGGAGSNGAQLQRLVAFIVADGAPSSAVLRSFLMDRLPAAAVPGSYILEQRLPRNGNGKIDRSALRARPCLSEPLLEIAANVAATPLEQTVMAVWRAVLGISVLTPQDDFFALGGKSLQAIQVASRLGIALQREVSVSALFRHPSVAALAQALGTLAGHAPPPAAAGAEFAPLLTIQPGTGPALFCIHPAEGLAWCYLGLVAQLPQLPIYGLQARGLTGAAPDDIDALVVDYVDLVRSAQPQGPYRLLGWSSGGGVAHAMAVQLRAAGEAVSLLAMMDAYPSDIWQGKPPPQERDALVALLDVIGASDLDSDGKPLPREAILARFRQPGSTLAGADEAHLARMTAMALHTMQIYRGLKHQLFDGDLLFFHAQRRAADAPDWLGWTPYVGGKMERIDIDSTHSTMSRTAPLAHIGRMLAQRL